MRYVLLARSEGVADFCLSTTLNENREWVLVARGAELQHESDFYVQETKKREHKFKNCEWMNLLHITSSIEWRCCKFRFVFIRSNRGVEFKELFFRSTTVCCLRGVNQTQISSFFFFFLILALSSIIRSVARELLARAVDKIARLRIRD